MWTKFYYLNCDKQSGTSYNKVWNVNIFQQVSLVKSNVKVENFKAKVFVT